MRCYCRRSVSLCLISMFWEVRCAENILWRYVQLRWSITETAQALNHSPLTFFSFFTPNLSPCWTLWYFQSQCELCKWTLQTEKIEIKVEIKSGCIVEILFTNDMTVWWRSFDCTIRSFTVASIQCIEPVMVWAIISRYSVIGWIIRYGNVWAWTGTQIRFFTRNKIACVAIALTILQTKFFFIIYIILRSYKLRRSERAGERERIKYRRSS